MSSFLSTSSVRHRSSTEAPSSLSINGTIISMRLSLAATLSMLTSQGPEHALQALMHHRHQFRRGYNASVCPEPQDPVYELLRVADLAVSYTHLRAHETRHDLVCRLLLEK